MLNNKPSKLIVALAMVGSIGLASAAELTPIQIKVLKDHNSMQEMSGNERRAFREKIFNQENKEDRIAYNRTYKTMSVANMLPKLSKAATTPISSRTPGTAIVYDNGVGTTNTGAAGFGYGNRFNTGFNPGAGASGALNPVGVGGAGTVTMVTFSLLSDSQSVAFVTIGTNLTGSNASTGFVGGVPSAVGLNTVTFSTAVPFNGQFFGGVWQPAGGTSTAGVVLGSTAGTVNGQGFHALSYDDSPIASVLDIPNANAIFRVQGTNLLDDSVPVELMNFSIE